MTTYIKIPFASSGDKTNPPDTDAAGGVNWTQGYPAAYSRDPATNPSAKRIEREMYNGILNRLSSAINEIQVNGVAPYITAADNGGVTPAYGLSAIVVYNDKVYKSLKSSNTSVPGANADWAEVLSMANVGTNSNQVPTNGMSPSSLTWSGYKKFPDGFLLQWNRVTIPVARWNPATAYGWGQSPSVPITLPLAFTQYILYASAVLINGGTPLEWVQTHHISLGATSANLTAHAANGSIPTSDVQYLVLVGGF